ncbi:MAG: PEP-CTERM sorting domain-containing protein [Nostoc sp. C3-bin3]|nr:PEP-CTERM sorting domain-containing protein [Nostoc sp. C3-bin3]
MIKSLFALSTLLTATTLTLIASTFVESAQAVSLQWSFQNAVFEDGGTLSGSFNYDADANTYSNINIFASGSVNNPKAYFQFQPFTYQTSTHCGSPPGYDWNCIFGTTSTRLQVEHYWSPTLPDRNIALFFSQPLTNAGGTITLLGFSESYRDAQIPNGDDDDLVWMRVQNREQVAQLVAQPSVTAVPEPTNIAGLALAGIFGTAQLLRRKQKQMS